MTNPIPQSLFGGCYAGRRIFLTGHTGFKGSWLTLWLKSLGAIVTGYSDLLPSEPSHFVLTAPQITDCRGDIRDYDNLKSALEAARPEIVFHLGAQPLVRKSYRDPLTTYATNVLGTANLLEACRHAESVKAVIAITTDKCYENKEWVWGYRENDRLGGYDPYSASKACCEIVVSSFRQAFPGASLLASCRAGNVIGGGDWAEDRLIPDLVRAGANGTQIDIRMPGATRPWQHVLDPLSGYLLLGWKLFSGETTLADAWNFGPGPEGNLAVAEVVKIATAQWNRINPRLAPNATLHEASNLMLDCSKAKRHLRWLPIWGLTEAITRTIQWYKSYYEHSAVISEEQLRDYIVQAQELGAVWAV